MNHTNSKSGRALDMEALEDAITKVTLGIKCNPKLKMKLALEAHDLGMSLSEYVELILANGNVFSKEKELTKLKMDLAHYENEVMKIVFLKMKGQTIDYSDHQNNIRILKINSVKDIFTILFETSNLTKHV